MWGIYIERGMMEYSLKFPSIVASIFLKIKTHKKCKWEWKKKVQTPKSNELFYYQSPRIKTVGGDFL